MMASLFYFYYYYYSFLRGGVALSDTVIKNHFFFCSLQTCRVKVHLDELESEMKCYWKQISGSAFFSLHMNGQAN